MSELAKAYYQERAAAIGVIDVPPILDGEQYDLLPAPGVSFAIASDVFCNEITSAQQFVLDGMPAMYAAQGYSLAQSEWQRMDSLPRNSRFITPATYANRHILPFVEQAVFGGARRITLESVARDEVPPHALRRATNGRAYYAGLPAFEFVQAYFVTSALGASGCAAARLTLLQGVHDGRVYRSAEYLTSRISGTPLYGDEIALLHGKVTA